MRISDWSSYVCSSDLLGWFLHAQRLMWAPGVVELDPVADHPAGVLLGFNALPVRALLLERPDDALDHAVLLRAVRRDEFLVQAVALHVARVVASGEQQAVVLSQQERLRNRGHGSQRQTGECE